MLLFIEGYPYKLDSIVKNGLTIREILKDVKSIPMKEDIHAFEYVGYCYSKRANDVIFFLPKVGVTPWTAACQTSLFVTNYRSLFLLMFIKSVMQSIHLILSSPSPPAFNLSWHQGLFQ